MYKKTAKWQLNHTPMQFYLLIMNYCIKGKQKAHILYTGTIITAGTYEAS